MSIQQQRKNLTNFIIEVIQKYNLSLDHKLNKDFKAQAYPITAWDISTDTVELQKNKETTITAKILHNYQDNDNLMSYSPTGVFEEAKYTDEETSSRIKPNNDLWGVVLPCKYRNYNYLLIGTFNNDFNNTAHPNELIIKNGDSEILITNDLISFKTHNILLNGKPSFEIDLTKIDLSNYYNKSEIDNKLKDKQPNLDPDPINGNIRGEGGTTVTKDKNTIVIKSSGEFEQIPADWEQKDPSKPDYIKHKPQIPDTSNYYTKTETKQEIEKHHDNTKADKDNVYTKDTVDTKLGTKQDILVPNTNIKGEGNTTVTKEENTIIISSTGGEFKQEQADLEETDTTAPSFVKGQDKYYTRREVDIELSNKQDKLTAGTNISIVDNVISSFGGGEIKQVPSDWNQTDPSKPDYIRNRPDIYNKSEIDTKLNNKADKDNTYTKSDVDNLLDDKADEDSVYDKETIDNKLKGKADKSNTYTKTETDKAINEHHDDTKADKGDIPSLDNYYTKDETYNKNEVDTKLEDKVDKDSVYDKETVDDKLNTKQDAIPGLTQPVWEHVKYRAQNARQNDAMIDDFYIEVTDHTGGLFNQRDYNNAIYQKTEELENNKANKSDIPSLDNYYTKDETYTKTETDNKINEHHDNTKADKDNVYTKDTVDTKLEGKADKNDIPSLDNYYNKSETKQLVEDYHDDTKQDTLEPNGNIKGDGATTVTKKDGVLIISSTGGEFKQIQSNLEETDTTAPSFVQGQNKYYPKTTVDDLLNGKADKSDIPDMTNYYDKDTVDSKLIKKANTDSVYNKQTIDEKLSNKADKSDIPSLDDYYTKTETDKAINEHHDDTKADKDDIPDMDNYYNKDTVDKKLEDKADKKDIPSLDDYYNKETIDNKLSTKQDILNPAEGGNITGKGGTTVTKENNTIIISSQEGGEHKEEFELVLTGGDGCVKVYESQNFIQILFDGKITIKGIGSDEGWGDPALVYGSYKPLNAITTILSRPLVQNRNNIIYGLVNKSGNVFVASYNDHEDATIYGSIMYPKFYK